MKKILTMMMIISLFVGNMTGIGHAYTLSNLSKDSKLIVTTTLDGKKYYKYRTNKNIGQVEKGAMYYTDTNKKIVTNYTTILKLETINLVKSKSFKDNTKENKALYEKYINDTKKMKTYIKFMNFQTSIIALGTNPTKFFNTFKNMKIKEFKEKLNPMVGLVKYAESELKEGATLFNNALNVKNYTYENANKALTNADKAYGHAYSMAIINKWCEEIESNLTLKNLIKALTIGFGDSLSEILNAIGIKDSYYKKLNNFITETAKKFGIDEKEMKALYDGITKSSKNTTNSKKYAGQIKSLYTKTALYKAVNDKKNATIKDKIVSTGVKETAKKIESWSKSLNLYTTHTINSIKSSSTSLQGKGLKGATVKAYVGNKQIGKTATVSSSGNYKITIPKQKAKTKITVKMSMSGCKTSSKSTTVK